MSLVLQISDTHFGTERPEVVAALQSFAAELRADLVILSGDITQRAQVDEFDAARRFVERIAPAALLAIPGNHDLPLFNLLARALDPYGRYAAVFGAELEPAYESQDLLVLGVNTTRARRHKNGEVSAWQIERVAQRLRRSRRETLRIVVTHHPIEVPPGTNEADRFQSHAAAARAWAAAGADLVMGGHIHLPFVRPIDGAAPLWVAQAGTAVSHRVRPGGERNSVNLVRYDGGSECVVERWDYDGRFLLAQRTAIPIIRGQSPNSFSRT